MFSRSQGFQLTPLACIKTINDWSNVLRNWSS